MKEKKVRKSSVKRKTKETKIEVVLNLDGHGKVDISTGIPFLNHMLEALGRHGRFDLTIKASGDLEVDPHHTVEDVGITFGSAVDNALGSPRGINRSGYSIFPMDDALSIVAIDISGRPFISVKPPLPSGKIGNFETSVLTEFFNGFTNSSNSTVHIKLLEGQNTHHIYESVFKAFGRALDSAVFLHPRESGIPSTKGTI